MDSQVLATAAFVSCCSVIGIASDDRDLEALKSGNSKAAEESQRAMQQAGSSIDAYHSTSPKSGHSIAAANSLLSARAYVNIPVWPGLSIQDLAPSSLAFDIDVRRALEGCTLDQKRLCRAVTMSAQEKEIFCAERIPSHVCPGQT